MAARKPPPLTSFSCARCGRRLRQDRWVYSRFTRNRYCIEIDACEKRAKKGKK
jgi:hypothetical protein